MISLELESEHGWLLETLLFLVVFGAVYLLLKSLPRQTFRWVFPIVNALLLTVFTVFYSGQFPLLLKEQVALFSGLHHIQSQLHQNQSINALLKDNRLLLVDVSHDLALIPDSSLNASWRSNQLITDRQKLAQFLKSLTNEQDSSRYFVDMVVCDLTFGSLSPNKAQDEALQAAFDSLNAQHHLLIAKSDLTESKSVHDNSAVNTEVLDGGSVDITKYYDGTFFTYDFFDSTERHLASLPTVLYNRLMAAPSKPGCPPSSSAQAKGFIKSDLFVPEFWIDNEDVSRETESESESAHPWLPPLFNWGEAESDTSLENATGRLLPNLFRLGEVTDPDTTEFGGRTAFLEQLRDNYNHCKRSIVFIGLFEDSDRDMHHTLVGQMHGSILLINMFMNLLAGSHLIGFGYLLYLMAGFWGVGYLLMQEPHHLKKKAPSKKSGSWIKLTNWLREKGYTFAQRLINNQAYILAFLVLLGAIAFFNHLINLVVIGVYIATVTEVFEELYHHESEHHE
ncbi:CHASE2 domain-containing protein [Spirosoma sp. HMF4905]|uniref:CHASE2 domain-containing protein n=1 Tax=Spirosoma arboris TaxID=2682092 RepID=A0A7K1SBR7_9BACT|nr:CHASE2 domain-containing protein [Spirosoma arboris]MVM31118.1 CHASE2 domain-containing protein [Spirosoma arboris]